jgi:hypothetical protein
MASLPHGLAAGQVEPLLESCDRDRVVARRDYAILVLLARLGCVAPRSRLSRWATSV